MPRPGSGSAGWGRGSGHRCGQLPGRRGTRDSHRPAPKSAHRHARRSRRCPRPDRGHCRRAGRRCSAGRRGISDDPSAAALGRSVATPPRRLFQSSWLNQLPSGRSPALALGPAQRHRRTPTASPDAVWPDPAGASPWQALARLWHGGGPGAARCTLPDVLATTAPAQRHHDERARYSAAMTITRSILLFALAAAL
jgi:hypothetical protein